MHATRAFTSFRHLRHPCLPSSIIHIHIMSKVLKYEGHNYFRQRLVLATLAGKVLKIDKIRSNDANPGLRGKFFPRQQYTCTGRSYPQQHCQATNASQIPLF